MNIFRKNYFLLEIYQRVKTKPLRLLWRLLSTVCYINNSVFSHFETISAQMKIILNSLTANIMSFCSWFLMQDIRVRLEVSLQPAIKLRCFPECSRLQLVLFWKKEKWRWKATCQNFLYVVMWFLTGFAKHHSLQYMILCSYKFCMDYFPEDGMLWTAHLPVCTVLVKSHRTKHRRRIKTSKTRSRASKSGSSKVILIIKAQC